MLTSTSGKKTEVTTSSGLAITTKSDILTSTEKAVGSTDTRPEVPKHFNSTNYEYEKNFCTCDLTENSCDINCCCDEECNNEDVGAFSGT